MKNPCIDARAAVLSAQTGRSLTGKSITEKTQAIVDGPNNAKPPHLCGGLLASGRAPILLNLGKSTVSRPSELRQEKSAR